MKTLIILAAVFAFTGAAHAQNSFGRSSGSSYNYGTGSNSNGHYVSPHVRSDGAYNSGGYRSNPNRTEYDNYGTRGNQNPYTGQFGSRTPRY